MINAMIIIVILLYICLGISVYYKIYALGIISTMGMVIIGVYQLTTTSFINNPDFLILGLGTLHIGLGSYLFINGSLEQLEGYT